MTNCLTQFRATWASIISGVETEVAEAADRVEFYTRCAHERRGWINAEVEQRQRASYLREADACRAELMRRRKVLIGCRKAATETTANLAAALDAARHA